MKQLLALAFSICISSFAFADSAASTVRTTSGQLVTIGDTIAEMSSRINQSPISMNSYETKDGETTITVSDYTYEIENILYTFTVTKNRISKITWIRPNE